MGRKRHGPGWTDEEAGRGSPTKEQGGRGPRAVGGRHGPGFPTCRGTAVSLNPSCGEAPFGQRRAGPATSIVPSIRPSVGP